MISFVISSTERGGADVDGPASELMVNDVVRPLRLNLTLPTKHFRSCHVIEQSASCNTTKSCKNIYLPLPWVLGAARRSFSNSFSFKPSSLTLISLNTFSACSITVHFSSPRPWMAFSLPPIKQHTPLQLSLKLTLLLIVLSFTRWCNHSAV